jgi:hypothetical protein
VKLHVAVWPQASLAVVVTGVVPTGNVLPLGGALETVTDAQPPVAELEKNTAAPFELVALTARFGEQVSARGGAATVTVKLQVAVWPHRSVAVLVTVVVPIGNTLPLGGVDTTEGTPGPSAVSQPPVAELLKNTVAPLGLVAGVVMLDGHVSTIGGATTVMVKVQLFEAPHASWAVTLTTFVPIGKAVVAGGV